MKSSNYISTKRAKKTPGKTVKVGGTQVMHEKGKKPISFTKGTLHKATHTPQDKKIPAEKMQKALHGGYGKAAQKKANFAKNVLSKDRKSNKK